MYWYASNVNEPKLWLETIKNFLIEWLKIKKKKKLDKAFRFVKYLLEKL